MTRTLLLIPIVLAAACGAQAPQHAQTASAQSASQAIWHTVGSWSGQGNQSTDSFNSDTGAMRIHWQVVPLDKAESAGHFKLTVHSAISGRPLSVAVDREGPGKGTALVTEDPRVFFFEVESRDLQWSFTIDQRLQ